MAGSAGAPASRRLGPEHSTAEWRMLRLRSPAAGHEMRATVQTPLGLCVSVRRLAPSRYELVLYIYCSCLTSMFPHRNHHSPYFNYPHIISHCMLHVSTVILIHISKAEVSRVNQVPIAGTRDKCTSPYRDKSPIGISAHRHIGINHQ